MKKKGQVLIGAVILALVLAIITPILIQFAQTESKWSVKTEKNTAAFHLAELAVEQGYQKLILTTSTWSQVSTGTVIAGYNFDTTYTDSGGGEYQIRLSSGTGATVWITGVGRDQARREIRAVKAQYAGSGEMDNAVIGEGSITPSGSSNVEWGNVISRTDISSADSHPRYYSAGKVDPLDTNPAMPNTDNVQWWSYYSNIPSLPTIDLTYYRGVAQTLGATTAGCGGTFYKAANFDFQGCMGGGSTAVNGTWYTTGNATFRAGSGGNYMRGVLIALGNLEMNGNGGATVNVVVPLPQQAWKEYGNDWAYYRTTWDPAAPATHAAAVASSYLAATNATIPNLLFDGLIYAGGNYQATGAGNASFRGAVVTQAQSSFNASATLFFNDNLTFQPTTNVIQRVAWQDVVCGWYGTNAVCP